MEPVGGRNRISARGAELTLKLDTSAAPVPADSTIRIRPRSALGLKYVELVRGTSSRELPAGPTHATRDNVDRNLDSFGTALPGRGAAINRTLDAAPELLGDLAPVMRTLSNPDNRLLRLLQETGDITRVLAPVANPLAHGFTGMANTFEALSRDPGALQDTIERSPG